MTPPLLKLTLVKGPRQGETLEYKPGSTIRIGRFVRGNEIAIKDAGISTKHLRIVSDSENWMIQDLGSSNGTIINSKSLEADTPAALRHGDEIKLGEYTSIVVSFETDVQADEEEEHKLPPRPRRTNRRLPVADPVKEKPEPPKRGRATRSKVAITKEEEEAVADPDPVQEKPTQPEPPKRGRATRSKVAIAKEEEEAVALEKKVNSRARGGKKNTEAVLDSIKLEVEDTPKGVEVSAMKRVTRSSRKIGDVESEGIGLEEMRRSTRSKRKEIGGDSFLDLDMVLSQARAKMKKVEKKSVVVEVEARDEDVVEEDKGVNETSDKGDKGDDEAPKRVEQVEIESSKSTLGEDGEAENLQEAIEEEGDKESEKDVEAQKGRSETSCREEEAPKRVEQVESTLGEEDVVEDKENEKEEVSDTSDKDDETSKRVETESGKSSLGEDGEEGNLRDAVETSDGGCNEVEEEEKAEQESRNVVEKVDLEKMTLGEWFKYMEVYLRKKIVDETEEMIEGMRAKSWRVHQYIAEQKQSQGNEKVV